MNPLRAVDVHGRKFLNILKQQWRLRRPRDYTWKKSEFSIAHRPKKTKKKAMKIGNMKYPQQNIRQRRRKSVISKYIGGQKLWTNINSVKLGKFFDSSKKFRLSTKILESFDFHVCSTFQPMFIRNIIWFPKLHDLGVQSSTSARLRHLQTS